MIGATLLTQLVRKPEYTIFTIIIADIEKALVLKKRTDPVIKVLVKYYKHLDAFLQKEAKTLAEY